MIKHPDSHVDHNLTEDQLKYLLDRFADRNSFFLESIELPEQLGSVPCGLWGPIMGDPPVDEADVHHGRRGDRPWTSRLVDRSTRSTRLVTVIAGPHEETCTTCEGKIISLAAPGADTYGWVIGCDHCGGTGKIKNACVLYTAFGGPASPQEPGDPGCKDPAASAAFWREHALTK